MGLGYRHLLAGALLASLALPASAEVVLTTEGMTGTGLPPGQTLPETPQLETPPPAPFTPKTLTTEAMQAWGPASASTPDSTPTGTSTTNTSQPALRRLDRQRAKEVKRGTVKPGEIKPEEVRPRVVNPIVRPDRRQP